MCPIQVDGLSNLFWGWGREDDELYVRMQEAGMTVSIVFVIQSDIFHCIGNTHMGTKYNIQYCNP